MKINKPVDLKSVTVTDKFWSFEMDLIRKEVIPYQWEILNDRVPEAAPSYCMHNFRAAGMLNDKIRNDKDFTAPSYTYRGFEVLPEGEPKDDEFYGFLFQDSDFSKWIEAVGYTLATHPNPELESIADGAIDIVCKAQTDEGYLDTYYIINGMDKIFTDLRDHHELYCLGHLIEGAIAYYEGTGKDKLLSAARKYADFVSSRFGPEEGKINGYPGHEIAEMALFRLSDVTGEKKYADLAEYFINQRGKAPLYFDIEHPTPKGTPYKIDYYHQAHIPVREQNEAVGHAVRAMYLYSGMADMVAKTGDEKLFTACKNLWKSTVEEKMYITGGVGATHLGEAFSFPFDLPNDTNYAETCASIGLVFFARRMLGIDMRSCYSDVMELALYNGILSGIALDGKSFFYVNPLEVIPNAVKNDERKLHIKPVRQKWFGCACCPPNIARLVASIPSYAYTEDEDTLFFHLYMSSKLTKNGTDVEVISSLLDDGKVTVKTSSKINLALRIPGWCNGKYNVNSTSDISTKLIDGYLYVEMPEGVSEITLEFNLEPKFVVADHRVTEDLGRIAVVRGPIVYCAEEKDNGTELASLYVDTDKEIAVKDSDEFGIPVKVLEVQGYKILPSDEGESYISPLYKKYEGTKKESKTIRLIPYRLWANRGEGEMRVYLNV